MPDFNLAGEESFPDKEKGQKDTRPDPSREASNAEEASPPDSSLGQIDLTPRHTLEAPASRPSTPREQLTPPDGESSSPRPEESVAEGEPAEHDEAVRSTPDDLPGDRQTGAPSSPHEREKQTDEHGTGPGAGEDEAPHADAGTHMAKPVTGNDDPARPYRGPLQPVSGEAVRRGNIFFRIALPIVVILSLFAILYYSQTYPPFNTLVDDFFRDKESQQRFAPGRNRAVEGGGQTDRTEIPAISSEYYLQVSAWPSYEQAERVRETYRQKDIPAIVRRGYNTQRRRAVFRVWLGPYRTPAEAKTLKTSLAGLVPADAFVDSLAAGRPETVPREPPARVRESRPGGESNIPEGFYIVVASVRNRDQADEESRRFSAKGFTMYVQSWERYDGIWYRVQTGPFASRTEAAQYLASKRSLLGKDAFVVTHGR